MNNSEFKKFDNIKLSREDSYVYGNVDGLSLQNIFYTRYNKFPSCYLFCYDNRTNGDSHFDVPKIFEWLKENIPADEEMELIPYFLKKMGDEENKDFVKMSLCVILNKSKIYARLEKDATDSYVLFDNENIDKVKEFITNISQFYIPPTETSTNYWRLAQNNSGFYLEKGRIKCPENFDVNVLYNDDFVKEDKKIKAFIEAEEKSGLVVLHGEKGTGKSTYIKHLVTSFPTKKFVYVPASFILVFGEPAFGSFLTTLNNHIIVLEDCENAIRDRKTNVSASAVSLLLNLTDGILSDDLAIKFICTFNEDMKNIDPALLRKGILISKYEFKPLSIDKAEKILKDKGIETKLVKPLSLADIFFFEDDSYNIDKKPII